MVNAVVLAGDTKDSLMSHGDTKALMKINGKFMIEYVIDSLREAKCVEKIFVVGSKKLLNTSVKEKVNGIIEGRGSIMENIKIALKSIGDCSHVIVCTCDIPMIFSQAIEDFVCQCEEKKLDLGYPIIEKSLNDMKYPDVKRTYVRLKDGTYTGGNIVYINCSIVDKCFSIAHELIENRKNPFKMGKILGFAILIKLGLGILRVEGIENRINKLFAINAKAIRTSFPEIGNDVDKIEDVKFINKYMNTGI